MAAQNNAPLSRDREILASAQASGTFATVLSYFRLSGPGWLQSAITLGGGSLTSALFLGVLGGYHMLWLQWIAIFLGVIMLSAISYVTLSSRLRPFDAINQHVNPVLGCGWLLATLMANIIWCMPQFSLCYDALDSLSDGLSETAAVAPAALQPDHVKAVTYLPQDEVQSAENVSAPENDQEPGEQAIAEPTVEDRETAVAEETDSPYGWNFQKGTLELKLAGTPITVGDASKKAIVSLVLLVMAMTMVTMSASGGAAAWWFDVLLKIIIGVIVLCFFGTVIYLTRENQLPWNEIAHGFIPNLSHWSAPSADIAALLEQLPEETAAFWRKEVVSQQKEVMISTVATAVGINMTFLLPYSLLARGWDRTFRGLARFDLVFGMLLPFILVTSCVVITSAAAFHAKADAAFLSTDAAIVAGSPTTASGDLKKLVSKQYADQLGQDFSGIPADQQRQRLADVVVAMPEAERLVLVSLVKRNSFELSRTLAPLFTSAGDRAGQLSSLIFAVGALAMGFSTIIVLMLINGYVFAELFQTAPGSKAFLTGAMIAGVAGASWPLIWQGESKLWLAISASTFGFLLLPIAYFAFWLLMNSKSVLGNDRPEGASRVIWNALLLVALLTTVIAAGAALWYKMETDPARGQLVLGAVCCFIGLVIVGFFAANRLTPDSDGDLE